MVVRKFWIEIALLFAIVECEIDLPILEKLLFGDVVEGVEDVVPWTLQRLSVFNLSFIRVEEFIIIMDYLLLSHRDFLLPSSLAVELLIVLAKVKATIVQTFIVILTVDIFAYFLEFGSALKNLIELLLKSGEDDAFGDLRVLTLQECV